MGHQGFGRLSGNLAAARQRAGLTPEQVAEASGVADYGRIERGEVTNLTLGMLCEIAEALDVAVVDLIDGLGNEPPVTSGRATPPGWKKKSARRSSHRRPPGR